jgi:O-antigen ligase
MRNHLEDFGWAGLFVMLPVVPDVFVTLTSLFGIYLMLFRRARVPWRRAGLIYVICGVLAQVLQSFFPGQPQTLPIWLPLAADSGTVNLMTNNDLAALQAWNSQDGPNSWAKHQPDGFWSVPTYNPRTRLQNNEIYVAKLYPIKARQVYTLSFYLRSAANPQGLSISFFTARGHHRVRPEMVWSNAGVVRFKASYRVQPGDDWLRPINLTGFETESSDARLELGFAQLELGEVASPFKQAQVSGLLVMVGPWFWLGSAILALGLMVAIRFVCLQGFEIGPMLVIGLAIQLCLAIFSRGSGVFGEGRAVGLVGVPNLFGHSAAMSGLLAVALTSMPWSMVGLFLASVSIWLSGSRAALLTLPLMFLMVMLRWRGRSPSAIFLWTTALVCVAFLSGILFSGHFANRLGFDASGLARLDIWAISWQAFLDHPFGLGPSGFVNYYIEHRGGHVYDPSVQHPHNLILGLLVEFGILGLIGWLFLAATVGMDLYRAVIIHWTNLDVEWIGLALVLLGALVLNVFDYTWFSSVVAGPVFASLGCWLAKQSGSSLKPTDRVGMP